MKRFNEALYLKELEKAANDMALQRRPPKPSFNPPLETEPENNDAERQVKKTLFSLSDDAVIAISRIAGRV